MSKDLKNDLEKKEYPGGIYLGEIKENKRNGYGVFTLSKSGDIYRGDWVDDMRDGYGEMIYKNGVRYRGGFKNNKRHGIGILSYIDGEKNVLNYKNGVFVHREQFVKRRRRRRRRRNLNSTGNHGMWSSRRTHSRRKIPRKLIDKSGRVPRTHPCPNVRLCWDFVERKMKMDTKYFRFKYNACFCRSCREKRNHLNKITGKRGSSTYAYPLEWVKFGLPVPSLFVSAGALDEWHVGFHGTRPNLAKIIIEESKGGLLIPGDHSPSGFQLPVSNPIDRDDSHIKQIFLSPSIKYCETVYTPPIEHDGRQFRVAFQVRIQPGTYKIGSETQGFGEKKVIDELFPNTELEWSTNRRNVCVISGLLIKREELPDEEGEGEEEEEEDGDYIPFSSDEESEENEDGKE